MNYLIEAFKYIIEDQYFWVAMGCTSFMGIFIGATLYDGMLSEMKKIILTIAFYAGLITMTNISRIWPLISSGDVHDVRQPFAGTATIIFVTIFYLVGVFLGIFTVNRAHDGRFDCKRKGDKGLFTK